MNQAAPTAKSINVSGRILSKEPAVSKESFSSYSKFNSTSYESETQTRSRVIRSCYTTCSPDRPTHGSLTTPVEDKLMLTARLVSTRDRVADERWTTGIKCFLFLGPGRLIVEVSRPHYHTPHAAGLL